MKSDKAQFEAQFLAFQPRRFEDSSFIELQSSKTPSLRLSFKASKTRAPLSLTPKTQPFKVKFQSFKDSNFTELNLEEHGLVFKFQSLRLSFKTSKTRASLNSNQSRLSVTVRPGNFEDSSFIEFRLQVLAI